MVYTKNNFLTNELLYTVTIVNYNEKYVGSVEIWYQQKNHQDLATICAICRKYDCLHLGLPVNG